MHRGGEGSVFCLFHATTHKSYNRLAVLVDNGIENSNTALGAYVRTVVIFILIPPTVLTFSPAVVWGRWAT